MANLGTLWFDVDLNLQKLQQSIQNGNAQVLKDLKVSLAPNATELKEAIDSILKSQSFKVNLEASQEGINKIKEQLGQLSGEVKLTSSGTTLSQESIRSIVELLSQQAKKTQEVTTATQSAAEASRSAAKAANEEAESSKKANVERERQMKLLYEVQTMYSKIANLSPENSGMSPSKINAVADSFQNLANKLKDVPPKTSLQELAAEFSTLKALTKGFFQEVGQSSKAVESIRLVRYALKEVNDQIASGTTSSKLEGFREQLQAINREMHNMMKAGDFTGIQTLFAGHKGFSDGVVNIIRQMVTEMRKLGVATQETIGITSHLTEAEQKLAASIKSSTDSMRGQSQVLSDLKTMATQYLGVWGAQAFIHNIIEIGGQLEMQRLSIGAILGDMAKADDLFGKIKNLAIKSPFGVVELDQMTKQLSAYGFEYNELFDMTKRLADISAATGTSVDRLALALGHVRSEAALSGYTLRQFSMANIPLAKKLSEHLTEVEGKLVSIADVRKRVRSKEIGYQEVLDVLKELTDEGGMFYNAQEIMSESVKAKFKNLKDSMDIMYGEIADSAVGKGLKEIASLLTTLTRHWQELGAVLVTGAGYWMLNRTSMSAVSKAMVEGNIAAGKFSAAQLEMAAHTGNLTKQMLLQAVATHKLSVADAEAAGNVFLLSKAQLQHVANTGKVASAMNMATIATSKYTVAQLRLFAMMRNLSLFNLAGFFGGIASGAKAAGTALLGLGKSLLPLLAISAIVELFTSLKREQEEYAESANHVGQQARNMMKDIDEAINSVEKGGKPVDTEALRESVKTMQQVVEQSEFYTAEQQRQVDGAKTLSDKYDVLLKQLHDMREEAAFLANSEDLINDILKNTGRNVVANDSETYNTETGQYEKRKRLGTEFFNNNLRENLEDVNKANSELQTAIQLMAEYQGVMDEAIKKNNGFGLSLDGKSWQEQIRLIAESGHWDEFVASVENAGSRFEKQAEKVKSASDDVRDKWDGIVKDDFQAIKLTLMDHFNMTEQELDNWAKNNEKTVRWMVDGVVKAMSKFGIAEAVLDSLKQKILNFFNYGSNGKAITKEQSVYDLQTTLGKQIINNVLKHNKVNGKGSEYNLSVKDVNAITGTGDSEKTVSEVVKAIKDRAQKDYQALKDTEKIYDKNSKVYASAKKKYEYSLNLAEANGISKSEIEKDSKKKAAAEKKAEAESEKAAKARTKQMEAQLKIEEELAKQRLELQDAIADAEVAAIENNAERERAQREVEFEKQKRQIEKQAEEWKKKAFELAKKEYEANPKNKTVSFFDTPTGKAGWQGISLTAEQEKILEANYKKLAAERQRYERELHEQQLKYMRDYLAKYGDFEERRKAITDKYNQAIKDSDKNNLAERLKLDREYEEEMSKLSMEIFKNGINWEDVFGDLESYTTEYLKKLQEQLREALNNKEIRPADAEAIGQQLEKIGQLISQRNTEWLSSFGLINSEMQRSIRYENELAEAQERVLMAEKKYAEALAEVADAKMRIASIADKEGVDLGNTEISMDNMSQIMEMFKNSGKDTSSLADAFSNLGKSQNNLNASTQNLGKSQNMLNNMQGKGGNQMMSTIAMIDTIIHAINDGVQELTKTLKLLNLEKTRFGQGWSKFAESSQYATDGWESLKKGNVGGVINGVVGSVVRLKDAISAWASPDRHDEAVEIQQEISDRIEDANNAIKRLTEQLEKSYGTDAIKKAEEAQKQLEKNQADMIKGIDTALWDNYGGGESDYAKWNRFGRDEGVIQRLMDKYGLKSSDLSWNALFNENAADKIARMLDDIRNTDFDLWSRFKSAGYNEGAVREWMEKLADTVKESDDIQKALEEKLTTTTKDNVIDDFKESLYDLADGSEDATDKIAENWQKMVNRMVIDNLVMKSMQADLEKWYDDLVALQKQRTNGEIDDKTYKERLATLKGNYEGIINSGRAMIDTFTKEGIIQPIDEAADKTKEYFEDLKGSWSSALTDMTKTSKDWKNDLIDQVLDDLVESSVMQAPFDAMIDGAEKHFDTFALYLENWKERYTAIMEDATLTDEERTAALKKLIDEQAASYDKQSAKSKQLAEGIGKDMTEAFSNSLDNLGDTLIDALLDTEKDAKQLGKEIGQTLAKEMLAEMLASEKYANWKEDIRKMWQAILKGEDTEHTIDDVLGEITKLNEAIANDEDIDKVVKKYQEWAKAMEEASTSFGNLHDTVMDAILDMENGLDDFATDMNQKLVKDLIEKQVFSIPIDITWQDEAYHFAKGFDEYRENWTQRYYDIYNDVTLSEEEREKLLQALVDEMIAQEQILNGAAQDLAKRTQKKKVDTTFTDMTDSFVSALMDMDGNLEDFANDMKKTIVQNLVEGFMVSNQIKPLLDDLQATFNYAIGLDGAEIKDRAAIINDGYTEILEDGTKVVHKGINELTDTLSPLKDIVKSVLEFIGYKFNETEDEIEENINDFTSTLNSALTSGETKASDFAKQLKEHIVNSLVEAYTATEEFQNGLNEVTDRLYHAIESGDELAITLAQQDAADFFDGATKAVERYTKALDTASDQTKKFDGMFDGMASDMLSTLMDFNSTAEDWAEMLGKNISQKIANEIVSTAVITPIINELNTAMQEAISDSTLPDGSIDWTNLYGEYSPLMLYIKELEERFPQLKQTFMDLLKGFGVSMDEAAKEGFSDLTGTFVSALSDMGMTAETFGRQIGKTMAEQMVKAYIGNKYGETMKDLNKRWFDALEKNDIGAIENIKKEIVDMYKTLANPEEEPELEGLLSAIREIEKQLDTTFSGMTDSWVSALMDMEGTADDFAKTVGKTMAQKILTDIIAPVYIQPLLNQMQETFNAVISQVGATWQEAAAAMRPYLQQVKEVYYEVQPMVQELLGSFDIYKESVQEAAEEVEYALQDLKSNFVSSLMDMTSSAEDFSKEISKILAQNWIENYVLGAKFDRQMEYWKKQYESIIGSGMSEAERKRQLTALRDSIATAKQSYVNQAMAIQELLGITADSNEQQATMNMADKITYDQADQLLGVNIAQQLTLEQILATLQGGKVVPSAYTLGTGAGLTGNDEQSKLILANLQSMSAMMQDRQDAMLTQVAMANSHLQLIRDYNKRMCDQVELHMASMDNKLTSLRKL